MNETKEDKHGRVVSQGKHEGVIIVTVRYEIVVPM